MPSLYVPTTLPPLSCVGRQDIAHAKVTNHGTTSYGEVPVVHFGPSRRTSAIENGKVSYVHHRPLLGKMSALIARVQRLRNTAIKILAVDESRALLAWTATTGAFSIIAPPFMVPTGVLRAILYGSPIPTSNGFESTHATPIPAALNATKRHTKPSPASSMNSPENVARPLLPSRDAVPSPSVTVSYCREEYPVGLDVNLAVTNPCSRWVCKCFSWRFYQCAVSVVGTNQAV